MRGEVGVVHLERDRRAVQRGHGIGQRLVVVRGLRDGERQRGVGEVRIDVVRADHLGIAGAEQGELRHDRAVALLDDERRRQRVPEEAVVPELRHLREEVAGGEIAGLIQVAREQVAGQAVSAVIEGGGLPRRGRTYRRRAR